MTRAAENRLLRLMERYGLSEFAYSDPATSMTLRLPMKLHPPVPAPQAGRFMTDHPASTGTSSFPRRVVAGETIGYLLIGPLILAISAEAEGCLPPPLLADGDIAGYNQPVF